LSLDEWNNDHIDDAHLVRAVEAYERHAPTQVPSAVCDTCSGPSTSRSICTCGSGTTPKKSQYTYLSYKHSSLALFC